MSTPPLEATREGRDVVAAIADFLTVRLAANKEGLPLAIRVLIPQLEPKIVETLRSIEAGNLSAQAECELLILIEDMVTLLKRGGRARDAAMSELLRNLPTAGEG